MKNDLASAEKIEVVFLNNKGQEIERAFLRDEASARLRALSLGWFYQIVERV